MRELVEKADREFILCFGSKKLSPIMKASAYIALKYAFNLSNNTGDSSLPLFFSFPDKRNASLWLAISLITNFFNEDYVYNEGVSDIKLTVGKKYSLFGSVGTYKGQIFDGEKIKHCFDFGGTEIYCSKNIKAHIYNIEQSKETNSVSHYIKNKKKALRHENPLSKIIEPLEGIKINDQSLKSKVIIISGRGNTKKIRTALNENFIDNKSLQQVFSPNSNIIIKPDFREYKNSFKENTKLIYQFLDWTKKLHSISQSSKLKEMLFELIGLLEKSKSINQSIDDLFNEIIDEFGEEEPKLLKLKENHYPGLTIELPADIKAVIVNDVCQLDEYPETINGFLNANIPVIFIANRLTEKKDFDFFNRLFEKESGKHKNAYRINWNSQKIQELKKFQDLDENYLDLVLWSKCIRYADQKIRIDLFEQPLDLEMDTNLGIIQKDISNLEGFEDLKSIFYKYLYPALYAIKNSTKTDESIFELFDRFNATWQITEPLLNKLTLRESINYLIKTQKGKAFFNTKNIPTTGNIFSCAIPIAEYGQINIPLERQNTLLPDSEMNTICFSGFPYKEYTGRFLLNSAMKFFIPEISIKCWPYEGELTYNYLKRHIRAGYFNDNITNIVDFPCQYLLQNDNDINLEIDGLLKINSKSYKYDEQNSLDEETQLLKLDLMQYEGYKLNRSQEENSYYNLKCNIIRFDDSSFMFLPYQSKLLGEYEEENGKTTVKRLSFSDLSIGLHIYKIKSDQIKYDELLPNDKNISQAQSHLNVWRSTLSILREKFNSISTLSGYLMEIKENHSLSSANPDILNLSRWLNDEEMIAPSEENLKTILIAGIDQQILKDSLDAYFAQLSNAYKFVYSARISLGHRIKMAIANQLKMENSHDREFCIKIHTTKVEVISKIVVELQESEIEVEYHYTRRFLC